jgi:hypothetical protein
LTLGWAEALVASGRPGTAAALLQRQASAWRLQARGGIPAGAALLAAVFLDPAATGEVALAAADELERGGGWGDAALATAAQRLQAAGRWPAAACVWRRLLTAYPRSDHAAAAQRQLLAPRGSGFGDGPRPEHEAEAADEES